MSLAPLSELTTIRVGGPPAALVRVTEAESLVPETLRVWAEEDSWLVLGGGSNLVVSDEGFDGTVIQVATRGVEQVDDGDGWVTLRAQAGEPWDRLVAGAVHRGLSGIEALSGIPGSVGAAPIQNIGAYGQEVAASIDAIDFLDYDLGEVLRLGPEELEFGYRTSAIKQGREGIVLAVELRLGALAAALSEPVAYQQLADALGVPMGARVPVADIRAAVLQLRAAKGMVLDPADPDSVSCGSFFTNPIVSEHVARTLPADAPRWRIAPDPPDAIAPLGETPARPAPATDDRVKLSAAWLIERAGVVRGFRLPGSRAHISTRHTLAIVNAGGATAKEVAELARYIQMRVLAEFGVNLEPEPTLVGIRL